MVTAATATDRASHRDILLRNLLILDFEATCDDVGLVPHGEAEIIEFPTLLYNIEEDAVTATFHEYVRPVLHPKLTPFCEQLTGITQVSGYVPRVLSHFT